MSGVKSHRLNRFESDPAGSWLSSKRTAALSQRPALTPDPDAHLTPRQKELLKTRHEPATADSTTPLSLRPTPPSVARPLDPRLGQGRQDTSLAYKLSRYEQNRSTLENLQSPRGELSSGTPSSSSSPFGITDEELEQARKALLVPATSRSEKQNQRLVRWTMGVDVFYGLSKKQRLSFCQSIEPVAVAEGVPALRVGDTQNLILIIFDGSAAIWVDRHGRSVARQSTMTAAVSPTSKKDKPVVSDADAYIIRQHRNKKMVANSARAGRHKQQHARGSPAAEGMQMLLRRHGAVGRRRALGSDAHYEPPVQMRFGPGDAFGVARALHNVECAVHGQAKEVKWVSHTVQALEDTTFAGIALTEQNYEVLKAAHERSTDEKQRFLRSTQSLCRCSHECIAKLAALSRRVWIPAGTTIAGEGGESDAVYFCVHGQVQVMKGAGSPAERVLNVMGDRACFGDWGVVNDQRRFASLKTVSDTELLVINAHNFKTSLDHAVLRTLAHNATVIKQKIGRESDGISGGIRRNDDDKTRLSLISDVGSSGFQLVTKKMAMKAAAGMRKEAVSALEQKRYGGGSSPRSSLKWRRQAR